jgi:uncharacterized protein YlxP (DUF503 family)
LAQKTETRQGWGTHFWLSEVLPTSADSDSSAELILECIVVGDLHWRRNQREAMPVAELTLEIRIEHAQSLKDRRHVVRSLKDQLKQGFNISVAEMDEAVMWQSATLGIVAISRSRDYLHGLMEEVERAARRMTNELGAELADAFWDYVER